jgi:hypothetical protein
MSVKSLAYELVRGRLSTIVSDLLPQTTSCDNWQGANSDLNFKGFYFHSDIDYLDFRQIVDSLLSEKGRGDLQTWLVARRCGIIS